ncbi:MAG: SRPBCC family protein [Flavisolibacter sp.]
MPKFDTVDKGVVAAQPMAVYKAVLDELAGVTHWSPDTVSYKLRGDAPVRAGSFIDVVIREKGLTTKFSIKVTKLVEAKSIEEEYAGDFVGNGGWTFEPADGKTNVQFNFSAKSNKLLFTLVSPFMNLEKAHSDITQRGFKACNDYMCKK